MPAILSAAKCDAADSYFLFGKVWLPSHNTTLIAGLPVRYFRLLNSYHAQGNPSNKILCVVSGRSKGASVTQTAK